MRTIKFFTHESRFRNTVYTAWCSECGELAERHVVSEIEAILVDHRLDHFMEDDNAKSSA